VGGGQKVLSRPSADSFAAGWLGWGQKVLSRPSADSVAVGRRQKWTCLTAIYYLPKLTYHFSIF
jgi:hypothetical protein